MESKGLKTGAKAALLVLLFSILQQWISIYQTRYQLISPLIPDSVFLKIIKPFMFIGFVSSFVSIIALGFYFYQKYWALIIIVVITITWQFVYPYFASH